MTRCKDCKRPLHQQVEKALSGESAMVWADDEGGWVCPFGGNEHVPQESEVVDRHIEVEYVVHVYAVVDLDEGKVVKVVTAVDGIESTGAANGIDWTPSGAEIGLARGIADESDDWPAWEQD